MARPEDLDPGVKTGAQLVNAIWATYRADDRSMHHEVSLLVGHDDPVVREEAICLLLGRWRDQRYRNAALAVLDHDPDFGVRGQAAFGLAAVSTDATRADDISVLLKLVGDPAEEDETRAAAYEALLILGGRRDFPSPTAFDPAAEIDWEWLSTIEGASFTGRSKKHSA